MVARRARLALAATILFPALGAAQQQSGSADPAPLRLELAAEGNEARYRVREQLARMDFPNDAIGRTSRIEGLLIIGADGRIVRDSSRFVVDLASMESDQARRDNYVRRNTLETATYPHAVFVPATVRGLPAAAQAVTPGEYTFELLGDLTVHGVTKPATWQVTARFAPGGEVTGSATTSFTFGDFGMTIPRVAIVLSVDDLIRLEYDFRLVPAR